MTWWQILIIAASVITGGLAGILIVRVFFRRYFMAPGRTAAASDSPVPPAVRQEPAAESTAPAPVRPEMSGSSIFMEINFNLYISRSHRINSPLAFRTAVWDSSHGDIEGLSAAARSGLSEIYMNIRLANSLVWLIGEFGDSTQELAAKYDALRTGIAERLSELIREEFKVKG